MELHKTKIDLPENERKKIIGILNQSLADGLDLCSQAKHAHWNVKGQSFIALHELFDRVAGEIEAYVDEIAERVTALGGTAMGTVRISAERSTLGQYPLEITNGADHVDALSSALADFGKKARANIEAADSLNDADTADLFTGISRGVDKLLWLVEAHNQS